MFLAGYILSAWTLLKAQGRKMIIIPGVGEGGYSPEVVDRSERQEALLEQQRDEVEGLGGIR